MWLEKALLSNFELLLLAVILHKARSLMHRCIFLKK